MTTIDPFGWVLIAAVVILLVALGGLISSILNHRKLERISAQVDHTNRNAKAVKQALEHQQIKQDAATDLVAKTLAETEAKPRDVTIINTTTEPVPTQDVNGKPHG